MPSPAVATLSFRVEPALARELRGAALALGETRNEILTEGLRLALERRRATHNGGEKFSERRKLRRGRRPDAPQANLHLLVNGGNELACDLARGRKLSALWMEGHRWTLDVKRVTCGACKATLV